jgi:polysaccharide transporter, PST family
MHDEPVVPERQGQPQAVRLPLGRLRRLLARRPRLAKVIENVAWLSFDQMLRMGVGLAVGVWVARYLGPVQFGQLSYALTYVGLFAAVAALGLQSVVVREIVRRPGDVGVILGSAFSLQLAGGFLALVAILVATASDALLRTSIVVLSIALPFRAADTVRYWFESQVESRYVVWVENGLFLVCAVARIGLILSGAGLFEFVVIAMAETLLVSVGLLWTYSRRTGMLSRWRADVSTMRTLLMNSWPYFLAAISVTLYMRLDVLMLQQMASSHEVGVYSAAAKISELLYVLPSIFVASLSPALIEAHQARREDYLGRIRQLYVAGWWFAAASSALLCLSAQWLVGVVFGVDFADAAVVLAIHVWGSIAVVHGVVSSQHLLVENLQKISLYRTLAGLCCNFVFNLALIPEFGARGAAWATVVAYFVATYSLVVFSATRQHALFMLSSPFVRGRAT